MSQRLQYCPDFWKQCNGTFAALAIIARSLQTMSRGIFPSLQKLAFVPKNNGCPELFSEWLFGRGFPAGKQAAGCCDVFATRAADINGDVLGGQDLLEGQDTRRGRRLQWNQRV